MDITLPDTIYVNIDAVGNLWIYNVNCRPVSVLHPWNDVFAAECAIKQVNTMTAEVKEHIDGKAVQYVYNRRACSHEAVEFQFKLRSRQRQ